MKQFITLLTITAFISVAQAAGPDSGPGTVTRVSLASTETGDQRNIDIWLPDDYDSTKKYAVIYMHDGQMLFDSTSTWNRQEWGADEVASKLMAENSIKACIIVGIWNRDKFRYAEYFPEKSLHSLSKMRQARLTRRAMSGKALGDEYLRFLVNEVKPYIDSNYSTYSDRANTIIMGSSMGGLISLYALCEYPEVFGGAGCLSTHFPMTGVNFLTRKDNRIARAFRNYLKTNLPDPGDHRIYFDYGTETLDKSYEPYQRKVDDLLISAGFSEKNWVTKKFENHDHSERSWNSRLDVPLTFLFGK